MSAYGNDEWVEWVLSVSLLFTYDVFANLQLGELCVQVQDGRRANVLTFDQETKFDASKTQIK